MKEVDVAGGADETDSKPVNSNPNPGEYLFLRIGLESRPGGKLHGVEMMKFESNDAVTVDGTIG